MTDLQHYDAELSPRPDLLEPVTDSWVASIADVVKLAGYICDTTFVPQGLRGSAPATAATILYGREIGIPPITALQTMHVINGRVGMAAELLRARVFAAGHELEVLESTTALCRMRGRRRGSETWTEVQWSIGDARQAGLVGGTNWQKYPRDMLVARCSAALCRLVFPDVTHGMLATEELTDTPEPGASNGQPVTAPKRVARAPRGTRPQAPPPEGGSKPDAATPADEPPVVAPSVDEPPSPETPAPPAPADVLPPAPAVEPEEPPPVVVVPGPDDVPLPVEVPEQPAPHENPEADPRVQAELRGDEPATQPQVRHIMVLLRRIGIGALREERLQIAEAIVQRRLNTFGGLTITDASRLITALLLAVESADPEQYMRWLTDEGQRLLAEQEAADREAIAEAELLDGGIGGE